MKQDEILQAAKEAGIEFKPLPRDLYCEAWLEQLEHLTSIIEKRTIERFMDSHEECTDFDGFTAQIVSMDDYHQAQEAIASVKEKK